MYKSIPTVTIPITEYNELLVLKKENNDLNELIKQGNGKILEDRFGFKFDKIIMYSSDKEDLVKRISFTQEEYPDRKLFLIIPL